MALTRPTIQRITLEATLPDGTPKTYTIDLKEKQIIALFWDDKAIHEILAPFYEGKGYRITAEHMERHFPHAMRLVPSGDAALTPELVGQIWDTPTDKDGTGVAFLAKMGSCPIINDL
ncbi:MAG: hypothetical protein IPN59_03095 [Holophaga sp.]|nr:hypothetical protein [Holophaga sp.]